MQEHFEISSEDKPLTAKEGNIQLAGLIICMLEHAVKFIFYNPGAGVPKFLSISSLKDDVYKAKHNSSNKGSFALKFYEIVCGSGIDCMEL